MLIVDVKSVSAETDSTLALFLQCKVQARKHASTQAHKRRATIALNHFEASELLDFFFQILYV